ncbi:MAG: hypothetical protein HY001_01930 [Candidatus Portnoybacteria bacterium]|nr:hypothetical protein [Candidatus Portnoybacteria bacterium]
MSSAKDFVSIYQIRDGVVILKNGALRAVLLVSSMNFELKSDSEKQGIIAAYQSFLNSLDYSLQILVNSREINLDEYLADLQSRYEKQENELLKLQIEEYLAFVNSLIEISHVVAKNFYVVVPYAPGEKEAKGFVTRALTITYSSRQLEEYKNQLWQRVKQIRVGLMGLGLRAEVLNTRELIELFYNFYNPAPKAKRVGSLYGGPLL